MLLFYLQLGLVGRKVHHFVEYTPVKCFTNFVQSAVNARRRRDKNANSSDNAGTMKLLFNSSYGCQIVDWSCYSATKYMEDEKTNAAINKKMFKRLGFVIE